MNLKNKVNIHNRFDIEVRDAKTGKLKKSFTSYNIVLNQIYTRLCGGLSYFVNIHFGSSTGTLSATRTSLFSHLGTKAAVDEEIVKAIPLSIWKRKIVLNPEEYVGSTISEVGIAFGATNTNLVTHSLLKDSEGNPISIVKTDTDVITIYATVFVTFDDSNPNLVYIGMPSSNTLVNYLIGGGSAPSGAFSLNDTFLANARLGSTSNVTWTSDTVNKQRKTNVLRFGTTVGNGQVKFLEFANVFSLEFPYSSVFNGQSYEGVSLGVGDGVIDEFILPSANIKSGFVIKKNGVANIDFVSSEFFSRYRSYVAPLNYSTLNGTGSLHSFSGDGNTFVFADSTTSGIKVTVYRKNIEGFFERISAPTSPGSQISGVGLSYDGNVLAICIQAVSNAYVYDWNGTSWIQRPVIPTVGPATFVKVKNSGNTVAIAHANTPGYEIDDWNGTSWVQRPTVPNAPSSSAGYSNDMTEDGNFFAYGFSNSPYFRAFDWDGSAWVPRPDPTSPIGGNVTELLLTQDKNTLLVGFTTSPFFAMYDWVGGVWVRRENLANMPSSIVNSIFLSTDRKILMLGQQTGQKGLFYDFLNGSYVLRPDFIGSTYLNNKFSVANDGEYMIITYTNFPMLYYGVLFTKIKFNTPPAIGDVITADYTVDGIHKTDQYVIDTSMAIQFGEGR